MVLCGAIRSHEHHEMVTSIPKRQGHMLIADGLCATNFKLKMPTFISISKTTLRTEHMFLPLLYSFPCRLCNRDLTPLRPKQTSAASAYVDNGVTPQRAKQTMPG